MRRLWVSFIGASYLTWSGKSASATAGILTTLTFGVSFNISPVVMTNIQIIIFFPLCVVVRLYGAQRHKKPLEPEQQWRCHRRAQACLQYPNLFMAVCLTRIATAVLFAEEEGISGKNSEGAIKILPSKCQASKSNRHDQNQADGVSLFRETLGALSSGNF